MKLTQNSRRAPGINDQGEIKLQRSTTNPDFSVYAVCFNLSGDLSKLTSTDTLCNNVSAFDIEIEDATDNLGQKCDVEFSYTPDVPIKNNAFSVQNFERYPGDEKWSFEATFDGNTATGTAIHQNLQRLLQPNMSYVFGFRNRLDGVEPVPVERAVAARPVMVR